MLGKIAAWFRRLREPKRDESIEELKRARAAFRAQVEAMKKRSGESQQRPAVRVVEGKASEA